MLALTRKRGESIMISENIEIVVLGISADQIKLGVIAPKNVPVHRKEVFEQIQRENAIAAKAGAADINLRKLDEMIKK